MPNDTTAQGIATPPTMAPTPGATDPSAQLDAQLQQLMTRTMAQRTHIPVPQQQPKDKQEMMQGPATTHAQGNQMFFHNLGALIGNAAQSAKQNQIKQATGVLQQLSNAHDKYQEMAIAGGATDPADIQKKTVQLMGQAPEVQEILSDKKKMKQLQKLGQLDLFNPDAKQDVVHEAAKRVGKANKIQQMMKSVGQLMSAHRDQQLKPPDQILNQVEGRSQMQPTDTKGAVDVAKTEADLLKARADMTKAQADIKLKFDFKPDAQGNMMAYDKTTGKGAPVVGDDGKPLTGQAKSGAAPKVATVEGVPFGVSRDGKLLTPDSPEWTPRDQATFEASKSALSTAEANKRKLAESRQSYFGSLPQAVLMKQDDPAKGTKAGELAFVTRQEAGANPAKYAPVSSGDKTMGVQARYGEIQATVDGTNQAIANLPDTGFDAGARAQLAYVMRSPHPESAMNEFMKSSAATTLTDAQIEYVQWLASLSESAQALVSLQGMGARSSDRMRAAVAAMLPGAATPSKKYAEGQMKKLQVEINALQKGVPSLGGLDRQTSGAGGKNGGSTPKKGDPLGIL